MSPQSLADGSVDDFFFNVVIPALADVDLLHLPSFLEFARSSQAESVSHLDGEDIDPYTSPQSVADGSVNDFFCDVIIPALADIKLSPLPSSLAFIPSLQARSVSQIYGDDNYSYGSPQALADGSLGDSYFDVVIHVMADLELSPLPSSSVIDSYQDKFYPMTEPSSVSNLSEKTVLSTDV